MGRIARELQGVAQHFQRRAAIAEIYESLEARAPKPKPKNGTPPPPKIMTTRHCSGPAIIERKTDETGKLISTQVHTICSPPAV
jgi:hypothetical protein